MSTLLQKPVQEFMTRTVISIDRKGYIKNLFKLFEAHGIMGVPVVDHKNEVVGMITESDLVRHFTTLKAPRAIQLLGSLIYLEDTTAFNEAFKKHCAETVEAFMTQPVICIHPDQNLQEAIDLMTEKKVSRLPVVDGNHQLIGIITRKDIIHQLAGIKQI